MNPQASKPGRSGIGPSWSVTSLLPLSVRVSKLVHDAVGVVDGHWAVLTQTLPLERCAEGSDLFLLVLLLLGKLHKNLPDREKKNVTLALLLKKIKRSLSSRQTTNVIDLAKCSYKVQHPFQTSTFCHSPALRSTGRSCTLQS